MKTFFLLSSLFFILTGCQPHAEEPFPSHADLIRIDVPAADQVISSPFEVRGEARGFWFFEASAPLRLYDAEGEKIGESYVQTEGNWMTEDFVPFRGTIEFETPASKTGTLVFEKDNPTGMPEYDDQISISIRFAQ